MSRAEQPEWMTALARSNRKAARMTARANFRFRVRDRIGFTLAAAVPGRLADRVAYPFTCRGWWQDYDHIRPVFEWCIRRYRAARELHARLFPCPDYELAHLAYLAGFRAGDGDASLGLPRDASRHQAGFASGHWADRNLGYLDGYSQETARQQGAQS
jgi:hypothetical protein